jgi:hypothetical protein
MRVKSTPCLRIHAPKPLSIQWCHCLAASRLISDTASRNNLRTRLALLGGELVEPFYVFIGQIGEDASHNDILISYHDIMSSEACADHPFFSAFFFFIAS